MRVKRWHQLSLGNMRLSLYVHCLVQILIYRYTKCFFIFFGEQGHTTVPHMTVFRLKFNQVHVGDVVLLKNPMESNKFLVRRLAALGGHEMESTCEKDEPFVIDYDHCWVLADNQKLKAKEAKDSRTFGPIPIMDIKGRVIYRFQSMKDHGLVENSKEILKEDSAVVKFELELNEMQKALEA
ncbi:Mitochondrial inner membrane protease subunit 1 [Bienertia sinuspersici]